MSSIKKVRLLMIRLHLFAPCGLFISFNFLSAYFITTSGIYNGDFLGVPLAHSYFEVWGFACVASTPYLVLYHIVSRVSPISATPIKLPKLFLPFAVTILTLALVLTLTYGVGTVGKEIYSVPAPLKPLVVLINRIDPVLLAGILILSPCVRFSTAFGVAGLLIAITLYRGSLQYLPVTLLMLFYKYITHEKQTIKSKKTRKMWVYILFLMITAFIIYLGPVLYEIREMIRQVDPTTQLKHTTYDFFFGKFVGRLSNLSALLIFESRYDVFYQRSGELHLFSYLFDCLKYVWGSFVKTPVMNHYTYFTMILDPESSGSYAMQTGVIPALGLSWMKSPIIMVFDIGITILSIYFTVRLSTFFLGYSGQYLAMAILIFAVLSGAPSQFSLPVFHLAVIVAVFLIIEYLTLYRRRRF
jgi:hypothetical protein